MKNNKYLFLILLAFVGCSKSKKHPTLLSELEKRSLLGTQPVSRHLAAAGEELCLKDTFTVDRLKGEVLELEKKFSAGTKVKGTWKHLNLEDLPIPQANFLKKYGNQLGDLNNPNAYDYSACKDVPCVFNTIYEKPNNQAGYVHYLWYLRMGHMLGASNNVYGALPANTPGKYNGKTFPVSAYLYRDKEIFAYWRLMKMLKAPHTTLTNLKDISRVPQGESFDFVVAEKAAGTHSGGEACGLAYSNGYVIMQDLCLKLWDSWDGGSFYDSVLHELTHQVDYQQGLAKNEAYRSDDPDYLAISKFSLREYKNAAGATVREWTRLPGIKLVTPYAGTSPAENFAETIAHFRTNGSAAKDKITKEHWDFTSKNYYFDKNFEKSTMVSNWLTNEDPLIQQLVFKAVGECSGSSKATVSTYFKKSDFDFVVGPSMLNCLGSKVADISKDLRIKVKSTEMDGCQVLTEYGVEQLWDPALKPVLVQAASKYLKELQTDSQYFARVQDFIKNISNRDMASEAFLSCSDKETELACYDENVIRLARLDLEKLNLPESQNIHLSELYLSTHPIESTKTYLNGFYRSFVASNLEKISFEAKDLYDRCLAQPVNDDAPPSGKYFTISEGYMVSSIYNCLNSDFPTTAKLVVRNLAVGDMKVQHPKEEVMLYEQVVPELRKSLEALYQTARSVEDGVVNNYIADDDGKLRQSIISNYSWITDVLSNEKIIRDCRKEALARMAVELRYHTKMKAFGPFSELICEGVTESPSYKTWLDESKAEFAEKSVSALEKSVVELAQEVAASCLVKFPADTNVNRLKFKKERDACLVDAWADVESRALKKYESDPIVMKFNIDLTAAKSQLDVSRRRLQLRVIKENF